MRARSAIIRTGVVVAFAFLAACGSSSKSTTPSSTTTGGGGGVTVPTTTGGTTVHVTVSDTKGLAGSMTLTTDVATAPAGKVTFVVKNSGTIDHEMVVLKLPTGVAFNALPITFGGDPPALVKTGGDKVGEEANVGETGEPDLKPGDTRTFTIADMKAGNYALVCNIAKHYGLGMRAGFTVS